MSVIAAERRSRGRWTAWGQSPGGPRFPRGLVMVLLSILTGQANHNQNRTLRPVVPWHV